MRLFTSFFKDKYGRIVIWQAPNLYLWAWLILSILERTVPSDLRDFIRPLTKGALIIWAIMEIWSGSSYFRRLLGFVVLLWTVYPFLSRF